MLKIVLVSVLRYSHDHPIAKAVPWLHRHLAISYSHGIQWACGVGAQGAKGSDILQMTNDIVCSDP